MDSDDGKIHGARKTMTRFTDLVPIPRILLWGAVVSGCIILTTVGFTYSSHRLSDFAGYYTASKIFATSRDTLSVLYNDRVFILHAREFGIRESTFVMYVNPPQIALLPLYMLDPFGAKLLWNCFSLFLLGVAFYLGMAYFNLSFTSRGAPILFGLLGCTLPFLRNLQRGQIYMFLLVLVLLVLTGMQRRSTWMTAVSLALLIFLKYFGWMFLVYFIVRRRWKDLMATSCVLMAGLAVSLFLFGVSTYSAHLETLGRAFQNNDFAFTGLPSVYAFFGGLFSAHERWNPDPVADIPWLAQTLSVSMLVVGLYFSLRRSSTPKSVRIETNSLLVLSVIFTPLAADHHYILLVPPLFLLLHEMDRGLTQFVIAAGATYLLTGWYPLLPVKDFDGWSKMVCFLRLYGGILLWVLILREGWRTGGGESSLVIT
jgi:Glycosyltransferase family 87